MWSAAWPSIRTDLGLSYLEIGLLLSVPPIVGNILEPPLGLLGEGRGRRRLILSGGIGVATALILLATGHGFPSALLALLLLHPAAGAFVGLSQAALMDLEPRRREGSMARWVLAGSLGVVTGPLLLAGALAVGLGWRSTFAGLAGLAVSLVALAGCTSPAANPGGGAAGPALRAAARGALDAIRDRAVVRWLALLQLADLGLDVLHAFLALYFVDVMGATPAAAAMAIVVWTAAGLIGDALVIPLLDRTSGTGWVRTSAAATLVVYPAFLLVDAGGGKLVLLGLLGLLNSGWYAVLQARLYAGLPGRSGTVMALTSAAGIAGAVLPLVIALASERWGLAAAMWLLLAGPLALVVGVPSTPRGAARRSSPPRGRASSTP